jgi:hypothetical protein
MKISKFAYTGAELLNYDRVPMANQDNVNQSVFISQISEGLRRRCLYAYDLNESCLE